MEGALNPGCASLIQCGEVLCKAGDAGPVWRVDSGIFVLKQRVNGWNLPVCLALPGDVIGIETCFDTVYDCSAIAVMESRVTLHMSTLSLMDQVIQYGIRQRQWRVHEMLKMQNGSVEHRLEALCSCLSLGLNGVAPTLDVLPSALAEMLDVPLSAVHQYLKGLMVQAQVDRALGGH